MNEWYQDRYNAVRVERNRYFVLLIIALALLATSVVANFMLSPLKTVVPYVIQVSQSDGAATVVKPLDFKSLSQQQTITLYFLYKYLNARMNYNYGLRQIQADTVRALSGATVYQAYVSQIDVSNPKSPTRLYQNNNTVTTKVISYSFPYPDIAQIHFYTEISSNRENQPSPRQYWLATIKFTYAKATLPGKDAININPVGFFVTDFQVSQETPAEVKS